MILDLPAIRELRHRASVLRSTCASDLRPFKHRLDGVSFRRLPGQESTQSDIGVTVTCTCLMALAATGEIRAWFREGELETLLRRLFSAPWTSSGLVEGNPFTRILVLRCCGLLVRHGAISREQVRGLEHEGLSLAELAGEIAGRTPNGFSADIEKYPPTPALAYWFIDGVQRLELELSPDRWADIGEWVAREFYRQLSYVSAGHTTLADPVALVMAAAAAARLRRIGARQTEEAEGRGRLLELLPSRVELKHSAVLLFRDQEPSGVWKKYHPMFVYPKAGANHCFTFEFLEACLEDLLDRSLVVEDGFFPGLASAVRWCEDHRVEYAAGNELYRGWNSGGQLMTLTQEQPESWATGVIHMFLHVLEKRLSEAIREDVLRGFGARRAGGGRGESWTKFLDLDIVLPGEEWTTVKRVVEKEIIDPILGSPAGPVSGKRSALLFGPPGTSKTSFAGAVADRLGWEFVEINPSHFLSRGLDTIYPRADEIFRDLMDLDRAVILFDEMDALVQRRVGDEGQISDVTRQFLTTCMLPKLVMLHDGRRVVFFMATNHQREFDDAIKRPGRFDVLLFMPPPRWSRKLEGLSLIWGRPGEDLGRVRSLLDGWVGGGAAALVEKLDRFSFLEMKSFLGSFAQDGSLEKGLSRIGREGFRQRVEEWSRRYITLSDLRREERNALLDEYREDSTASRIQ